MQNKLPLVVTTLALASSASAQNQLRWFENCSSNSSCTSNMEFAASYGSALEPRILPIDFDLDNDIDFLDGTVLIQNQTVNPSGSPNFNGFVDASSRVVLTGGLSLSAMSASASADFDLDGDPDVAAVTAPQFGGGYLWLLSNVVGEPQGGVRQLLDARAQSWITDMNGISGRFRALEAGDFNGDGRPDLMAGMYSSPNNPAGLVLFTNTAIADSDQKCTQPVRFTASYVPAFTGSVETLAVGDLDGDGDLDVALGGGTVSAPIRAIARNDGEGNFTIESLPPVMSGGYPLTVEAADLDADGDLDVLFGHMALGSAQGQWSGGQIELFENIQSTFGTGFISVGSFGATSSYSDIEVGDIDEDGLVDIVTSCRLESAYTFQLPGRTRVFSRAGNMFVEVTGSRIDSDLNVPQGGWSLMLEDLDLDLDLDIVVAHPGMNRPGIFTNLLWQLEAPRDTAMASGQIDFDLYHDVHLGAQAIGAAYVYGSLTPPTHIFPGTADGYFTSAPWQFLTSASSINPTVTVSVPLGAGQIMAGTTVYSQAYTLSFHRGGVGRLSNVIQTTLN